MMSANQIADSVAYCGLICALCQPEAVCSCKGNNHCGKGYRHRDAINMTVAEPKVLMVVGNVRMRLAGKDMLSLKK